MRKQLLIIMVFAFWGLSASAKTVDVITAQTVGQNFFNHTIGKQVGPLTVAYIAKTQDGSPEYFIFNINQNDGFIIISGDDAALPVLGYSTTGHYDVNVIQPVFEKWMEGYKQQILYIKGNNLQATSEIQNQWQSYKDNQFNSSKTATATMAVNPLLGSITWSQDPYENQMCPIDVNGPGGHAVTGCPATAMAQIMKYWNYPAHGTSSHSYASTNYGTLSANFGNTTYDWANMPNSLSSSSTSTQVNAVATLMYHCGVAVDMGYTATSSGSYVIESPQHPQDCSQYAYRTYFGYDASTIQGLKRSNYTDANWKTLLKAELDASRPIQYAGFAPGSGHTFVCDGYDANDMFHMNWGWGGQDNGNFLISALNPGGGGTGSGTGTYNLTQQAVIGIKPVQSTNNFSLGLNSAISFVPNPTTSSSPFSVTVDVGNFGTSSFIGDIAAAVFSNDGVFIDFVQLLSNQTITNGFYNTLTFNTTGIGMMPGTNTLAIYYSAATDSTWTLVNQSSFINPIPLIVSTPAIDIKVYSNIIVSSTPIVQNQTFSVTADVANFGTTDFNGWLSADIFNSDGNWVQTINELSGVSILAGFANSGYVFNSTGLSLAPGSYYIMLYESPDYSSWYLLSNDLYSNPVNIDIVAPPITPDVYENNNTNGTAYNLALSFSSNTATKNTVGSNFHIGSDNDYYKIVLASGYSYQITGRVHDSYNSGNGNTYTCDGKFSYSTDNGSTWSDSYDDVMPGNIVSSNGGTMLFGVSPYFVGLTGTYLLDLTVERTSNVGIDELTNDLDISIYPNPASESISFKFNQENCKINKIEVYDAIGQLVKNLPSVENNSLDVSNLSKGIYFVSISTNKGIVKSKFNVSK